MQEIQNRMNEKAAGGGRASRVENGGGGDNNDKNEGMKNIVKGKMKTLCTYFIHTEK